MVSFCVSSNRIVWKCRHITAVGYCMVKAVALKLKQGVWTAKRDHRTTMRRHEMIKGKRGF